jgi:hypothetical protein
MAHSSRRQCVPSRHASRYPADHAAGLETVVAQPHVQLCARDAELPRRLRFVALYSRITRSMALRSIASRWLLSLVGLGARRSER